ncbi:MAG: EAL domain-containing protein [Lachnospiraceae bacterium]|nr:EAL domain-containing protein [Lachnospiraceae bacterium]
MIDQELRQRIECEMQAALERGEFQLYLQPKVNMVTSKVYGAEALSRWVHPVDGIRKPDVYIPIFEDTGFIVQLDMYMFEEVCKVKARWHNEGRDFAEIPISINMSRLHLFRKHFVEELFEITQRYGISPSELDIEITENVYLAEVTTLNQVVAKLQKYGFYVSIDDFGSGYSALNMLKDIPANIIKIDKEFLQLSTNSDRGKRVIKNIILLCKELKFKVMVEGVETEEQLEFLTSFGCEIAQGFYYAKPIHVKEFEDFTKEHFVVSVDIVKFSFNNNLVSDDGRYEGEFLGEECEFVQGIAPSVKGIRFKGGHNQENCVRLPVGIIHNDNFSVSHWVKVDKLRSWTATIFAEYENGFFQYCPLSEPGEACYRIRDRRRLDAWCDSMGLPLETDRWYHVVMTYDAAREKAVLYIDGLEVGHCEEVPALYFLKRLLLGGDIYKPTLEGSICELIFYDRPLEATEVQKLYRDYISMDGFKAFSE